MLADLSSAPTMMILVLLGGILAAAVWIAAIALRHTEDQRPPNRGSAEVVVGPTLRDGVWCRLVAFPDGYRRIEVLGPNGWVASHRDVAQLLQAIPGRSGQPAKDPPKTG
jgi:hypothetical protein